MHPRVETWAATRTPRAGFPATHWSAIFRAGKPDSPQALAAFEELCQNYRTPLYAYLRQRGYLPYDAEDLVQAFFVKLIEKRQQKLSGVDPVKGTFRSFLIICLKNCSFDELARERAVRRDKTKTVSLDQKYDEEGYEPTYGLSPDQAFDRSWANTVLAQALCVLQKEMADAGQGEIFHALKPFLEAKNPGQSHAEVASALGKTPNAVRNAVPRFRARYHWHIRSEIAKTLVNPTQSQVDEELRALLQALE